MSLIKQKLIVYFFSLVFFTILFTKVNGQTDCIINLNEAEKLYQDGKIEKIPSLLNNCIENGFNKENKITALRLLTIVYLFEDNLIKAEKTLLQLLKTDPEFQVNKTIDPLEFINLFNSYNTAPVFSIGGFLGVNNSFPRLIETYSKNSFNEANPKYSPGGIGFTLGLQASYHLNNIIDINIEPAYTNYTFTIEEKVTSANTTTAIEKLNYIELPVYGSYSFYKVNLFDFYGEFGLQYSKLISSNFDAILRYTNNEFPNFEGPTIDTKEIRKDYNFMTSVGVGTKIKLNRSNLQFRVRYKFGYVNIVNQDLRYSDHDGMTSKYHYIDNDTGLTNLSFSISFNREFYIHKKKPSNQSNYEIVK